MHRPENVGRIHPTACPLRHHWNLSMRDLLYGPDTTPKILRRASPLCTQPSRAPARQQALSRAILILGLHISPYLLENTMMLRKQFRSPGIALLRTCGVLSSDIDEPSATATDLNSSNVLKTYPIICAYFLPLGLARRTTILETHPSSPPIEHYTRISAR